LRWSNHEKLICLSHVQHPTERSQAEQLLRPFGLSTEYIPHCKVHPGCRRGALRWRAHTLSTPLLSLFHCLQTILDNSSSPYAQLLASSSLIKLVTEHTLAVPVKLEMRNYFLNYLDRCGIVPTLEGINLLHVHGALP
jgi:exportin-7